MDRFASELLRLGTQAEPGQLLGLAEAAVSGFAGGDADDVGSPS